jgi:hypothetical protein
MEHGPREIGKIPNVENHVLLMQYNDMFALGPKMFTSGSFKIELNYSSVGNLKNTQLETKTFMNTNLQLLTIIKSDNISICCGIHFEIKDQESNIPPVIRIKQFRSKNNYKMKREFYERRHTQPVMVMIAYNDARTLLTFGLDYYMYVWIIMEDSQMGDKTGELECIDEWYIKDQPVTCAKITRGERFLILGTFRGTVLITDPNKKEVLTIFDMKYQIPVNSLEEGLNDPDDSCIYAIGDVHASIQKFMLTKEQYDVMYGGIIWPVPKDTSEYMRRNRRYTAKFRVVWDVENKAVEGYKEKYEKEAVVLRKFTSDRK